MSMRERTMHSNREGSPVSRRRYTQEVLVEPAHRAALGEEKWILGEVAENREKYKLEKIVSTTTERVFISNALLQQQAILAKGCDSS